jgi:acyl CoA:acetate/3-ketoacid CoA transferase alpha subunit/acyl CoA:acetate/3-ketoacid CoA transferase beta subunit
MMTAYNEHAPDECTIPIKLTTIKEAVETHITAGCHIGFGGFSPCRNAMAISHEIIRQKIGNLHISSVNPAYSVDILIGAGLVTSVESGCLNMERLGLPRNFCRAVEQGRLLSEDYEHLGMTLRYLAGAMGMSFIPTKSALGSDIARLQVLPSTKLVETTCPFTGDKYLLLPACSPDVAVIHVTRADEQGNCQIEGSAFADEYIAKASQKVIIVAEQIVPTDVIRKNPQETVIPAYRVNALIHQPHGAYPTAVPGFYDYDYEALQEYQTHARKHETFQEYLNNTVHAFEDFETYLDAVLPLSRMHKIACDPRLGYSPKVAELVTTGGHTGAFPEGYTRNEMMIVAAARQFRDGEIAIIGTGLPMAACTLAMSTHAPNLEYIVETGIGGIDPRHACLSVADTRLLGFAKPSFVRNTLEALGFLVHRGLADIGFLGGAQIDMYGNLNATAAGDYFKPSKRFPGSGGANPIASCAKRLMTIIKHERRRFLERVEYITSPGFLSGGNSRREAGLGGTGPDRVITDLAIMDFEPETKRMRVVSLHPGVSRTQVQEATDFELLFADDLVETPPPSETELHILRSRIGRVYLGG